VGADGDPTDAELIGRSQADPRWFAMVFDRHFNTIHRYLARRVGPDRADDLTGEVFRIAFQRREAFDLKRDGARPWLYGIATNLLHAERRQEERRLRAMQRLTTAVCVPLGIDQFDQADRRVDAAAAAAAVAFAVGQLAEVDRDALVLYGVEGLTYTEVAGALAVPIGTVRSRISRARLRLRELLEVTGQQVIDWSEAEEGRDG
jgi:RNA polymerase sigma-70 factor (ECF subfamily)